MGSHCQIKEKVCEICGGSNVRLGSLLVTCTKCITTCEHVYCMGGKLKHEVPEDWACESCITGTDSVLLESRKQYGPVPSSFQEDETARRAMRNEQLSVLKLCSKKQKPVKTGGVRRLFTFEESKAVVDSEKLHTHQKQSMDVISVSKNHCDISEYKIENSTKKSPLCSRPVDPVGKEKKVRAKTFTMRTKFAVKKKITSSSDVAEDFGSKKRAMNVKSEATRSKRTRLSKNLKDSDSDSDFEVSPAKKSPKKSRAIPLAISGGPDVVDDLNLPKKNPAKAWGYIYDQHNLFVAKAVSTASFKVVEQIKTCLSPAQLELFSNTCFGHFLKMPKFKAQPQIFHGLLLREVQQKNDAELWVMVSGVRLRFSIEEFAVISGLDCEGDCNFLDYKREVNSLCAKYWPTSTTISKDSVRECFTTRRWGYSDEDAVKLAVLFFIEWFVLSGTKSKNVPQSILDIVDSGLYNDFPWGRRSFEVTISSLKGKLDRCVNSVKKATKVGKKPSVYYTLIGCPHVFQVWFYECCKYLSGLYCKKVTSGVPRIIQWTCSSQPSFKILKTSVFDISNDKLKLCNLKPTSAELKSLKLSSFKFETDYKAYKEEDDVEEASVADLSEMLLKLNDFSEKLSGFDFKLDLIQSNQEKLSSELLDLKKFVSSQFNLLSGQLTKMQDLFSSEFADVAKEKQCASSNDEDDNEDGEENENAEESDGMSEVEEVENEEENNGEDNDDVNMSQKL